MSDDMHMHLEMEHEDTAAPDPGSTGALITSQFPAPIDGTHTLVDVHLIAHPPYQRTLSRVWAEKESKQGWNPALGYGIVVNQIPLHQHRSRPNVEVDAEAVSYAIETGAAYVYEVIIGQHRSYMAKLLSRSPIPALVLDNVNDDQAALLFVQDARTTRPLRGYDVHIAALTRHESRAVTIQYALDQRGIVLVPSGLVDGKVSCIRALEKICGPDVSTPDVDALDWCLDTLLYAFPTAKWPDPIVHGLLLWRKAEIREGKKLPTAKALGGEIAKRPTKDGRGGFGGDVKLFSDRVRDKARTTGSASPHVAATVIEDMAGRLNTSRTKRYEEIDA